MFCYLKMFLKSIVYITLQTLSNFRRKGLGNNLIQ